MQKLAKGLQLVKDLLSLYLYDTTGRRVAKRVQVSGLNSSDLWTLYTYDGWRVLEERETAVVGYSPVLKRQFVYGNYLDEPLAMDVDGGSDGVCVGGEADKRYLYLQNTLFSVTGLVDAASGALVEAYAYDPYGRHWRITNAGNPITSFSASTLTFALGAESTLGNPYLFTGQRFDPETGLHYYKNRYYDCGLGRFVSRDPIGYNGGINLYEYVESNPIIYTDPTGFGVYKEGSPQRPTDFEWDNAYVYDPSAVPTRFDRLQWMIFCMLLRGAELADHLPDATRAYRHYRDASGTDLPISYDKAFREDSKVRSGVENEFADAQAEAERLRKSLNKANFQMTGSSMLVDTATENWQKAIGGHRIWGGANVEYNCLTREYTIDLTISMEDFYNFNEGQGDIATGLPDSINGRFAVFGWAKSFYSKGELLRTITWTEGDISGTTKVDGEPHGEPRRGRERRERR